MEPLFEISYALDTFYFLMSGVLVMWMAAGFSMLEAGMVRSKNTAEILTKNISLFAIACVMFMLVGYNITDPGDNFISSWIPGFSFFLGAENAAADVTSAIAAGEDALVTSAAAFSAPRKKLKPGIHELMKLSPGYIML